MKPVDVNNGERVYRRCCYCEIIIPQLGRGHDVRKYTCVAPGGVIDGDYPIDEPCNTVDQKGCKVWLNLIKRSAKENGRD